MFNCFERFCKAEASKTNSKNNLGQNRAVRDAHWTKIKNHVQKFFHKRNEDIEFLSKNMKVVKSKK